jgi:predicted transcriptional regulator
MRQDGDTYPTRLKDSIEIKGHNDYNCLEDLERFGFLNMTTGMGQHITITEKGFEAMKQLSEHKTNGETFSTFVFVETT